MIMKRIMSLAAGMLAFAFSSTASQAVVTSVTATSFTISKSSGALTVRGTIQCTAGHTVGLAQTLAQVLGGKFGFGAGGFVEDICTGGIDPWSAPGVVFAGSFQVGNAVVAVTGIDVTDGTSFGPTTFHVPVTTVP
jgi:hypothetical protein